jgi:hypothetical protein
MFHGYFIGGPIMEPSVENFKLIVEHVLNFVATLYSFTPQCEVVCHKILLSSYHVKKQSSVSEHFQMHTTKA